MQRLPPSFIEQSTEPKPALGIMKSFEAIPVLNQILQVLCRSLVMYLADAKPWTGFRSSPLQTALSNLAADRRLYAERLARLIGELGGCPDCGRFPIEFAAKNDLSLDYVVHEVIEGQEQDIARIDECVSQLTGVPRLHALAEEIYGNARGHLESLVEATHSES
jgi:hypothetical protein